MTEKMVGETGFEPATLCSQSKQETKEISGFAVNRGEKQPKGIKALEKPRKPFAYQQMDAEAFARCRRTMRHTPDAKYTYFMRDR